jgi:prepilin-type N-terminal cleavage/methylation domain-containing protein
VKIKKGAFTIIEMMISIALFSIIMIFLYQALDMTKKSNNFYGKKLNQIEEKTNIKKLLFQDLINSDGNITIDTTKDDNTILEFKTSNLYHNPFYTNVTYFVSKKHNLIRCESSDKFDKNKVYNFTDDAYIDIVDKNVTKFKISYLKKYPQNYILYIQYINKNELFLNISK